MPQRHGHHRKHESKRPHKSSPHRESAKDVTRREETASQPPVLVVPATGPWSSWALDPEGRGFYYRNRINAAGRYEWDFSPRTTTLGYAQPTQQTGYHQSSHAIAPAPAPAIRQTLMFPTGPAPGEDQPSTDSDFTNDFDDEVTSLAAGSGFVIPAIIDVDTKNNVKVLVPDPKTGEATIIWDNKRKHAHKLRASPNVKVREWLHKE
ncbi:hypothetical protein CSHISOI_10342 [Colletotrichum shisoi]|uniref:Uncharacterized protein n=1 Tax=Colletotrichum shisoi TaxID=2078593 RepID=A0A5Q4BEG9_9PEZI|nr:hypothetical protein CSHISOI_10342 [Colletotrichum shisoi]